MLSIALFGRLSATQDWIREIAFSSLCTANNVLTLGNVTCNVLYICLYASFEPSPVLLRSVYARATVQTRACSPQARLLATVLCFSLLRLPLLYLFGIWRSSG